MLFTYFLNDFEIVQVAPIITGIIFVFTFHMCCISIVRSLYFTVFSVSLYYFYYYYYYYYYYYSFSILHYINVYHKKSFKILHYL